MEVHHISPEWITIDRVGEILKNNIKLALSEESKRRIVKCREYLDRKMETQKEPIYGITTGFGSLCNISIDSDKLSALQKNLVMSHACSVGERVPADVVKLMLFTKIQSLSYGNSGVQLVTVERLVDMFNNNILPLVYRQGSLGASGDLAPLANLSLPLLGLGEVEMNGEIMLASEMLEKMGWQPITLQCKEGLALLNGTQFMSSYGVHAVLEARKLSRWADKIGALSLDAFDGRIDPFMPQIQAIRPHQGQIKTGEAFRALLAGSELIARPKVHVQDPYSFRCIPQVHGAAKDTIDYVAGVLETEINSVTDNPTVFPRRGCGDFGRQLPWRTYRVAYGLPCGCPLGACQHFRAPHIQAHSRCARSPVVPGGQTRCEQRFHDSAVCRCLYRQQKQGAVLACFMRQHPLLAGSGGSCVDGLECRNKTLRGGGKHPPRACHRAFQCCAGA